MKFFYLFFFLTFTCLTFGQTESNQQKMENQINSLRIKTQGQIDSIQKICDYNFEQLKFNGQKSIESLRISAEKEVSILQKNTESKYNNLIHKIENSKIRQTLFRKYYQGKLSDLAFEYNSEYQALINDYKFRIDIEKACLNNKLELIELNGKIEVAIIESNYKNELAILKLNNQK